VTEHSCRARRGLLGKWQYEAAIAQLCTALRCHRAEQVQFHFLENRFDTRDLGAVLDHEDSLPPSGM
jgi:hypothetical protein